MPGYGLRSEGPSTFQYFCPQMALSTAQYICIAAGEKFQQVKRKGGPFCAIAAAFPQHCSRVSAALQPRFRGIAAAFRNHAKRIAVFICECEAVPRVSHVSFRCKACAQEHLGGDVGRALPHLRQLGSTICCTVFDVPPSGGGLKTWIETARYPMMPVFCTGPGAK